MQESKFTKVEVRLDNLKFKEGNNIKSTLGDLIYKPRDLTGLKSLAINCTDSNAEEGLVDTKSKNMNGLSHKVLNVFLQTAHNSIVDLKDLYQSKDYEGKYFIKIPLRTLLSKIGFNFKSKTIYKDLRYISNQISMMQGMYLKYSEDDMTFKTQSIFNNIILDKNEDIYFSFNDAILYSILNDYCGIIDPVGSDYITLNVSEIHKIDLSQHTMMLYEFLLANIYGVTKNNTEYAVKDFFSFISNDDKSKPSQKIDRVLNPAIKELEEKLGIKVFYVFEKYLTNNRLKNIRLRAYKTDKYKEYENSKSTKADFYDLDSIINWNIFKTEETLYEYFVKNFEVDYLKDLAKSNNTDLESDKSDYEKLEEYL